ncbi:uncharacterized protein TM35_000121370 [Trypanosoma theileri]|uniref:Uncharacterized protein n=1 Tax=Trypanosoma theileri TaxID=67003 RepID=A0A1X0NXE0_9TRYP|nr:uncharacterized protein TM35_000121370 [Trypanosoma theileri]ORC89362.1 hypothetical protein TM35_000121370 [Trypanosoma theileri]
MLRCTGLLNSITGAEATTVSSLLRRSLLLRWRLLALRWDSDTNVCVLADGTAEGLPRGTRLEMYGTKAKLIKLHTLEKEKYKHDDKKNLYSSSSTFSDDVKIITATIENILASLAEDVREVKRMTISPPQLNNGESENDVLAEWSLSPEGKAKEKQQPKELKEEKEKDYLLMENGIVFPTPESTGLRVLRVARQAFAHSLITQLQSQQQKQQQQEEQELHPEHQKILQELQEVQPKLCSNAINNNNNDPLAILDVSEFDCTFSRVATQIAVERGLEPEQQFHVSYVPLTNSAAATATVDTTIASLLRLVAHPQRGALSDPLHALQSRYFTLGSYTVNWGSGRRRNRRSGSKTYMEKKEPIGVQLANVMSKMHRGSTLIVNLVGEKYQEEEEGQQGQQQQEEELQQLRQEAKALISEALSRGSRWGVIIDEVLPACDCYDTAVSFIVSLD